MSLFTSFSTLVQEGRNIQRDKTMSDAAAAPVQAKTKTPRKKAATKPAAKPRKPVEHPKYIVMVVAAIKALKDHKGASRQAILKYVKTNYKVGDNASKVGFRVNFALRNGVKNGVLKHSKPTTPGASGRFRLGEKKEVEKKPKAKKPKVAKTKPAKAKAARTTPKKGKAAKMSPKKAQTAKPKAAKKSPEKVKTAKPETAKPAKTKTPEKKVTTKKPGK